MAQTDANEVHVGQFLHGHAEVMGEKGQKRGHDVDRAAGQIRHRLRRLGCEHGVHVLGETHDAGDSDPEPRARRRLAGEHGASVVESTQLPLAASCRRTAPVGFLHVGVPLVLRARPHRHGHVLRRAWQAPGQHERPVYGAP